MANLPKPPKPLKILTIDGGGLQGISTLLILDKLLRAIAKNNGVPGSKPRPCDVFDVIAGIGPGGWLALLLGRFQMDVSAALAEWYHLIDCIAPRSKTEKLRMRLMQHTSYDTNRLVEQIDQLTEDYETDKHMFFTPPNGVRCKHVFVSALKTDSMDSHLGYNLFRTYECPKGLKLLDGPSDPHTYPISHAFAATGAARYFTPPWKEKKSKVKFLDIQFPSPHNITELALNEMWGLYGNDVEISVVVNIGPGTPNATECRFIARRFSWGKQPVTKRPVLPKRRRSSGTKGGTEDIKRVRSYDYEPSEDISHEQPETSEPGTLTTQLPAAAHTESKTSVARRTTFGSDRNIGIEEKLRRDEDEIELNIRRKLRNIYPDNPPPYYRLAPATSAPGTAQNDTSSPKASSDATREYLRTPQVEADMDKVARRIGMSMQQAVLAR